MALHQGSIRIYKKNNVYDEALERINILFDDFPNVMVGFSGGKDSTVCLNLALKVAEERNRLPLRVVFLDQEAEYQNVIDYMRNVMADKRVDPYWIQAPFKINNATSFENPWLYCWKEGDTWMREKEDISIKENLFGEEEFHGLFKGIAKHLYGDEKCCYISGVRAEESPTRTMALTHDITYKYITWGKKLQDNHYTFYPIYDWSYTDVWKAIHDGDWEYCKIYDFLFQHGVPVMKMRVSNLHHETALDSLFLLQECEPETWNKLVQRLEGINTTTKVGIESYKGVKELPYMFSDWKEYRDHLLDNLVVVEKYHKGFIKTFLNMQKKYGAMERIENMYRVQCNSVLSNDFQFTKLNNWMANPKIGAYNKYKNGIRTKQMIGNQHIPQDNLIEEIKKYNNDK